jgi:hypothetical protein
MLMHGCFSPGFILLEVGNHGSVSILSFFPSITSLTKKPSYFHQYSFTDPHLKFLVHVRLFHQNMSLEVEGRYGYHGEVEDWKKLQNPVLIPVTLAERAMTHCSEFSRQLLHVPSSLCYHFLNT